jgi:hypothetical protein
MRVIEGGRREVREVREVRFELRDNEVFEC